MRFVRTLLAVAGLVSLLNAGPRGVLEFEDGNRVTGELSKTTADHWVFQSDRFGELRPARADAVFRPEHATASIPLEATPVLHSQTVKDSKKSSDPTHPWWRPHSLRGNIYGLISSDAGDSKEEGGLELRAVWAPLGHDEFRFEARWLDKRKNDTQGDLRTSLDAYWRVDVGEHWFTYLGSDLEWDDFKIAGLKPRYFLQRYQVGFGYNLVKSDRVMSRVGATWNFFRFESDAIGIRFNTDAPSLLIENEVNLSWGIKLHQIGQIYFWADSGAGWGVDNEIEVTKAIGSYWHVGTRHEWRKNGTDVTEFPFSKWRIFLGLSY